MCHFLGPDSIIQFFSAGKSLKDNYSARETYDMIFFFNWSRYANLRKVSQFYLVLFIVSASGKKSVVYSLKRLKRQLKN